jgi:hypothetical protein
MDAIETHPSAVSVRREPRETRPPANRRTLSIHPLALVLLASLVARVVLWARYVAGADPAALLYEDANAYHQSAQALLHTGTFSVSPQLPFVAQTLRTPGYPSFLAAVYSAFGERPAVAILVQSLLGLGSIALVWLIARWLWGARVALLASALFVASVSTLQLSLQLLTETLFTLALLGAIGCGVMALTQPRRRGWALGMGMMLAACTLIRPAAYYLALPVALGVMLIGLRRRWSAREIAWTAAAMLVPYAIAIGGWQLRNHRVSGSWAFSQVDAEVLLRYRGAAVVALRDGISFDEARARLAIAYPPGSEHPTIAELARWRAAGTELVRAHPLLYARVMATGVLRTFLVPAGVSPPREGAPAEPGWRAEVRARGVMGALQARMERRGILDTATFWVDALRLAVVLAAATWCIVGLVARRRLGAADAFMLGVALYLLLVHAGPTSGVRTRVALEPVLAMYAARGLAAMRPRTRIAQP